MSDLFSRFVDFIKDLPDIDRVEFHWNVWLAEDLTRTELAELEYDCLRTNFEDAAVERIKQSFTERTAFLVLAQLAYVGIFAKHGVFYTYPVTNWPRIVAAPILQSPPGK